MRTNVAVKAAQARTHEGAVAATITPVQQLRRAVLSCLLFEDEFYQSGWTNAAVIAETVPLVQPSVVAALAVEARSKFHLRHVPLYLSALLARHARGSSLVSETIAAVIQRADELGEFLAIYARVNGVAPSAIKPKLSNQVRKGLAVAFHRFNAYGLAKYDRAGPVRLRDALFLCHARPKDEAEATMWKALIEGTLPTPDTWEVALSAGADKRETFERLISEGQLGYLALIRNLRNMVQSGVNADLVRSAILARKGAGRVLPFRFVAAAMAAPMFEPELDQALCATIAEGPRLAGRTVVLVDVSGSMHDSLSARSDMTRMDAAATLASMINAEALRVFSFSDQVVEVPPRRGMAGVNAVLSSQPHYGTRLIEAVNAINSSVPLDRLIVITDEQAHMTRWDKAMPDPTCSHAYLINVASAQHGVGYGAWTHLDGLSEHVLRWIVEHEAGWDDEEAAA